MSSVVPAPQHQAPLTVPQAARLLGISTTMAYEMAARNELPGMVRIGRLVKVHRPTLDRWLEEQAYAGTYRSADSVDRRSGG